MMKLSFLVLVFLACSVSLFIGSSAEGEGKGEVGSLSDHIEVSISDLSSTQAAPLKFEKGINGSLTHFYISTEKKEGEDKVSVPLSFGFKVTDDFNKNKSLSFKGFSVTCSEVITGLPEKKDLEVEEEGTWNVEASYTVINTAEPRWWTTSSKVECTVLTDKVISDEEDVWTPAVDENPELLKFSFEWKGSAPMDLEKWGSEEKNTILCSSHVPFDITVPAGYPTAEGMPGRGVYVEWKEEELKTTIDMLSPEGVEVVECEEGHIKSCWKVTWPKASTEPSLKFNLKVSCEDVPENGLNLKLDLLDVGLSQNTKSREIEVKTPSKSIWKLSGGEEASKIMLEFQAREAEETTCGLKNPGGNALPIDVDVSVDLEKKEGEAPKVAVIVYLDSMDDAVKGLTLEGKTPAENPLNVAMKKLEAEDLVKYGLGAELTYWELSMEGSLFTETKQLALSQFLNLDWPAVTDCDPFPVGEDPTGNVKGSVFIVEGGNAALSSALDEITFSFKKSITGFVPIEVEIPVSADLAVTLKDIDSFPKGSPSFVLVTLQNSGPDSTIHAASLRLEAHLSLERAGSSGVEEADGISMQSKKVDVIDTIEDLIDPSALKMVRDVSHCDLFKCNDGSSKDVNVFECTLGNIKDSVACLFEFEYDAPVEWRKLLSKPMYSVLIPFTATTEILESDENNATHHITYVVTEESELDPKNNKISLRGNAYVDAIRPAPDSDSSDKDDDSSDYAGILVLVLLVVLAGFLMCTPIGRSYVQRCTSRCIEFFTGRPGSHTYVHLPPVTQPLEDVDESDRY
eukprot:TRINITY_DN99_c0_g1_i1.p1 TRINITY_DN99_c0_g1~~TRINITY_DN99_c0_g1_i1.p1  ORF type:complete len:798 (-),score=211.38 TRINITY_DN99_c0_g1_i1:139-2532(-)